MAVRNHDKKMIQLARGTAQSLSKARNQVASWGKFRAELASVARSKEHFKDYMALPADEKNHLKAANGWYLGGSIDGGRRNRDAIKERTLIVLDVDDADADFIPSLQNGTSGLSAYELAWHTTKSHNPQAPRLRICLWTATRRPMRRTRALHRPWDAR